jgi:dephospho-CoA kinase
MTELPSIAFIGRQGSGKTAIATALLKHGYERMAWADPIKELASQAYGPIRKGINYEVMRNGKPDVLTGREILQRLGTEAVRRNVDEDFWVRAMLNRLDAREGHGPVVIDDTRFPNELDALVRRGFVVVSVVVPDEVRIARLTARDRNWKRSSEDHDSERQLDLEDAHIGVINVLTPDEAADALIGTISKFIEAGGTFIKSRG